MTIMEKKIVIGTSSCLLGEKVRFDSSHKRARYLTDTLSEYFDFQSFCPEMAIGLGVPRPAIHLIKRAGQVSLVNNKDESIDYTGPMLASAQQYCAGLEHLSGYVLKSKSPSCGMERVSLYAENGYATKDGTGMFAGVLMQTWPNLPVEEEGRLNDPNIRENFIERVFAYRRWQDLLSEGLTVKRLMDFHKRHKFILLAHCEKIYRELGKLVAGVSRENIQEQAGIYIDMFFEAMRQHASRGRHVNVLQHGMGYLKQALDADDKADLIDLFEKYARGEVPLVVPVTMLRYHFRKNPHDYINEQFYMSPYPEELMLRNHV